MAAILGSHNSMTYLPPKLWLMRLFSLFWRCQTNNVKHQYDKGVRCFDLRIRYVKDKWVFAHGLTLFDNAELIEILNYLNTQSVASNEAVYVRLILETRKSDMEHENKFKELCREVRNRYYGRLMFFEARRKFDWVKLYNFDNFEPNVVQYVGSMQTWYGKIWPWLYWKLHNKEDREQLFNHSDDTIVLYDFI